MAQQTKAFIKGEIATSSANGLLGGSILNDIVDSYQSNTLISVTDYSALVVGGDWSAAFNAAMAAAGSPATGNIGGTVYVPPGNYPLKTGITIPPQVRLIGAGQSATFLQDGGNNTNVIITMGSQSHLENFTIYGCGQPNTGQPFPNFPAVAVGNSGSQDGAVIRYCTIWFGFTCVQALMQDIVLDNCTIGYSYSSSILHVGNVGQVWAHRTSFDQLYPQSLPAAGSSLNAWAANAVYTVGTVVTNSNVTMQCVAVTGDARSGGVAPSTTVLYQTNIVDNHVTWQAVNYNVAYAAVLVDSSSTSENYFNQCDFSGCYYFSIFLNSAAAWFGIINSIMGGQIGGTFRIAAATSVFIHNMQLTSGWNVANDLGVWIPVGFTGSVLVSGNRFIVNALRGMTISATSAVTVTGNYFALNANNGVVVDAGIGSFIIAGNIFAGGAGTPILVAAGGGDHYNIVNNLLGGLVLSDGGTGIHKTVTGNN